MQGLFNICKSINVVYHIAASAAKPLQSSVTLCEPYRKCFYLTRNALFDNNIKGNLSFGWKGKPFCRGDIEAETRLPCEDQQATRPRQKDQPVQTPWGEKELKVGEEQKVSQQHWNPGSKDEDRRGSDQTRQFSGAYCDERSVLHLCCTLWQPLAACGY